ncbi:MAG: hypothetical protein AB1755_00685 [Candidatus Omnitrophota bacterium]
MLGKDIKQFINMFTNLAITKLLKAGVKPDTAQLVAGNPSGQEALEIIANQAQKALPNPGQSGTKMASVEPTGGIDLSLIQIAIIT